MSAHRDWRAERRARTHRLIDYGGLVAMVGLDAALEDDRATLLGALLDVLDQLAGAGSVSPEDLKTRWRRRGLRAFDAAAQAKRAAREGGPSA